MINKMYPDSAYILMIGKQIKSSIIDDKPHDICVDLLVFVIQFITRYLLQNGIYLKPTRKGDTTLLIVYSEESLYWHDNKCLHLYALKYISYCIFFLQLILQIKCIVLL